MDNTSKISAIVRDEHILEVVIHELLAQSVSRADISVQGAPAKIKEKYGLDYIAPKVVQDSSSPPTEEPFLNDDFGWVVAFSFALPFIVCIIIGIFIIGDVRSNSDNLLYGISGAVIGAIIGYLLARCVKHRHEHKIRQQEEQGGYVLWVVTHTPIQQQEVMHIVQSYNAEHITLHPK